MLSLDYINGRGVKKTLPSVTRLGAKLTRYAETTASGHVKAFYECLNCGIEHGPVNISLLKGICGKCSRSKPRLAIGSKINNISVLEDKGNIGKNAARILVVKCHKCGSHSDVSYQDIKNKQDYTCKSCASKATRAKTLAGVVTHSHKNLYRRLDGIKQRCYNKNHKAYSNYGGKGVTVCKEWLDSFEAFETWALANGFKEALVIDKDILCDELGISPKIYSPETCQWVTKEANASYSADRRHNG